MDRKALVLFAVALHPLWLVGRAIPGSLLKHQLDSGITLTLPIVEASYMLDLLVVAALLAFMPPTDPAHAAPKRPSGVKESMSGFSVVLTGTRTLSEDLLNNVWALAASTVGFSIVFGLSLWLRPELYAVEHMGGLTWFMLAITTALHAGAQVFALIAVTGARLVLGRRSTEVTMDGRVLTVGADKLTLSGKTAMWKRPGELLLSEGDHGLTIRGPGRSLSWIAEQIGRIEHRGSAEEVPAAIGAVRDAARS